MRVDGTPALKAWAALRAARRDRQRAADTQERTLLRLVRRAAGTRFGRDHGFASIASVADFQARVPLRTFDDHWHGYFSAAFPLLEDVAWPGTIPYFAVSSGTATGRTKNIPVTREMVRSNNRAGIEMLGHHVRAHPGSHVLGGKNFMLGGSVALEEIAPGVRAGDLSGIARAEAPAWSGACVFPPMEDALEADWEAKIARLAKKSLAEPIRTVAGTPSWLLLFFERLAEAAGGERRLAALYPELELVVHGGMSFAPYASEFARWMEGSGADLREVYPASEGFVASADRGQGEGLLLNLDIGLFFEFVPLEERGAERPTRHWVGDAEVGRDYELVLTTCSGLWAYRIGDTVRLVTRDPPRLVVTGRTSWDLSAFGEHVSAEELEEAILAAAAEAGRTVAEFSVGARFPGEGDPTGQHLVVVEFEEGGDPGPQARAAFARTVDETLKRLNEDYEVHRRGDYQLKPPEVTMAPPGTFVEWMRARGRLGGQNKVPRVLLDPDAFASLRNLARRGTVG